MIKVYTAISGEKDSPRSDIECMSIDKITGLQGLLLAKRFKIRPPFEEDINVWLDGNIYLNEDIQVIVDELLGDADMAIFRHQHRKTIYEEFKFLRAMVWVNQYGTLDRLIAQEQHYRDNHLGLRHPLCECGVLIRRNNERVRRLMELWWNEINNWQERDQVSLPVALQLCEDPPTINYIHGNVRNHKYFTYKDRKSVV